LILRKIIEIVVIRCHILKLKCTKFDLQRTTNPLAEFKGPASKGRGEKKNRREGQKRGRGKGR